MPILKNNAVFTIILLPFSWIYAGIMFVRNKLFDWKWYQTYQSNIYTIGVGNLALGGTGKTPCIAYLIDELSKQGYKIGVVSRGYGRSTKGLKEVFVNSKANEVGDEPLLLKMNFPQISFFVAEQRKIGIRKLEAIGVDVLLLDDNYQHRYVKAHFQLLLSKANRLFTKDHVVPAGYLRESKNGAKRADCILVTNSNFINLDANGLRNQLQNQIKQYSAASVYFSSHQTQAIVWLNKVAAAPVDNVILIAGIANPQGLLSNVKSQYPNVISYFYKDHFNYGSNELKDWLKAVEKLLEKQQSYVIMTTEKDWVKIKELAHPAFFKKLKIGILPVKMVFEDETFINLIKQKIEKHHA